MALWLSIASFIRAAFDAESPRVTVFALTLRVHLHALGGWGITLPWLTLPKFPSFEANVQ